MTPAARIAAASEVLDAIRSGMAAEQALTRWARQSRYAGSKDRAAVRDHVFDVLRRQQTAACLGGGTDGRALMIGLLRADGRDPAELFTGEGHAPAALTGAERDSLARIGDCDALWNLPDWLVPEVRRSLGAQARETALALQARAPVTLRVNLAKTTPSAALDALQAEGIGCTANPLASTALTLQSGARSLRQSRSYLDGWVELQDAASQAVVEGLPKGVKCLDYCAGGGGKSLALAAQAHRQVVAHDADPRRMTDLAPRALRAGVTIRRVETSQLNQDAPFDLVLCDAPCSGSGAWRRAPDAKWSFTPERLDALRSLQGEILDAAMALVGDHGALVYATCSVLRAENEEQVSAFLERHRGWVCTFDHRYPVCDLGDGFYVAHLTRAKK